MSKETIEQILTYPIRAIPSRGIEKETCEHFGVRVALSPEDGKTVVAIYYPCYREGKLTGFEKKDLTKGKDEEYHFTYIGDVGKDTELFGQNVAPTGGKKVFITEGKNDTLAAWQVLKAKYPTGNPAVVSVGSTSWAAQHIGNNLKFLDGFQETVIAFDQDECTPEEYKRGDRKGKEATQAVSLIRPDILVATFSEKDANDMLLKGKSDELYWALVSKAKPYVPEEVYYGDELTVDDLMEPLKEGVMISAFPKLSSMLHGLRNGEMTILLAPTKSGKTTISREIGYALTKEHKLVGHFFLEEDLRKSQQGYIALDNNVLLPAFRENPSAVLTREQVEKTKAELIDNGKTIWMSANKLTPQKVLSSIRYMANKGADKIILDHLSYVFSGTVTNDERKEIDLLLHELAVLKKELNIHILVVAHIKRAPFQPKKDKNGDVIYPYWIPVNKEDGRGSGAFEQLCDNMIVIEPEVLDEFGTRGRIRLKVVANREWDLTGESDVVIMDRKTGRMVNAEHQISF